MARLHDAARRDPEADCDDILRDPELLQSRRCGQQLNPGVNRPQPGWTRQIGIDCRNQHGL